MLGVPAVLLAGFGTAFYRLSRLQAATQPTTPQPPPEPAQP